jgi:hypothetical protein
VKSATVIYARGEKMDDKNTDALAPCLFCEMAMGRIRPNVVFENDRLMAFLDIGPIRRGHLQIVPRKHFAYFDDLPGDLASEVMALGQKIARAHGAEKRLTRQTVVKERSFVPKEALDTPPKQGLAACSLSPPSPASCEATDGPGWRFVENCKCSLWVYKCW